MVALRTVGEYVFFFFFQAEDGIRDVAVTGVQTCALPILFLEVSPEESYARKGEYSVDYLARRSAAYRRIAPLVPSAVVLPNADLDATCRALERAVEQRLSA